MDSIKGAIMLRQRFENIEPRPRVAEIAATEDAPPIFHWIAAMHAPEVSAQVESDAEA